MYVGDRSGKIYQVNQIGEEQVFAQLEPSVSAYHLAFGPDDALYVTAPTVTSFDSIYRIDRSGQVETFCRGFGRPQGWRSTQPEPLRGRHAARPAWHRADF